MNPPPARRALAEFLGTVLLTTVVVGSGIMAQRLSPADVGLQLLENSTAAALGLAVLILIFAPVSGAHFNPAVSLAAYALNRRKPDALSGREVAIFIPAQVAGAILGTILANLMFALPAVTASTKDRSARHLWLGEVVATAGLILLIFSLGRTGRGQYGPAAVGAYIGAACWFTSSTSFANPALAIARASTNTSAGIKPSSVPAFVVFELLGAVVGIALIALLYPTDRAQVPAPVDINADLAPEPADATRNGSAPRPLTPQTPQAPMNRPSPTSSRARPSTWPTATAGSSPPNPSRPLSAGPTSCSPKTRTSTATCRCPRCVSPPDGSQLPPKDQGATSNPNPEVLFICVHCAGRSHMAAALLTHHPGGAAVALSAGSAPTVELAPAVGEALRELSIDLADALPKPLTDEVVTKSYAPRTP